MNGAPRMKSMTCAQLGGACDAIFSADSFDEIAALSQQHGREMYSAQDSAHMQAMEAMMDLMKSGNIEAWMQERRSEFDAL